MKKFGICIIILTIIFTILLRIDKYCDCENFIFNTTMIMNGNYYLVTKEDMKIVEVSALQWYYTNFISSISLVLWILTGLLYLYNGPTCIALFLV